MIEVIRGLHNLRSRHQGCVASIGNFDGVHLGHQALIARVTEQAAALKLPAQLISFDPTPMECFCPDKAPLRVQSTREKLVDLERYGIDRLLLVRFTQSFAAMPANTFVDDLLVGRLGVRHLVIGDDFRFGKGREGDFSLLQAAAETHGFSVEASPTVEVEGARVSSSRLREALSSGNLTQAEALTGRRYTIRGRIRSGLGLGRRIGSPTLNIEVRPVRALRYGVYVVTMCHREQRYAAVANFGLRPTVEEGRVSPLLEVHVLGAAQVPQMHHVAVEFNAFIRDEQKFADVTALQAQIAQDVAAAQAWIESHEA